MVQSSIQHFHFQEYKIALPSYFTDQGKPARSWEFQEPLVFKRFDSFVERLHTMLEFFSTAVQVRNVSGKKSLSSLPKVHEAGESGDWWDPWESLDKQHWQGLRGVQGKNISDEGKIPLPKRQHFKNCNSNSTIHSPRKLLEPTSLNQRSIHTQSHL